MTLSFPILTLAILASVSLSLMQCSNQVSCVAQSPQTQPERTLRLNEIQSIGTHNSYHLSPPLEVLAAVGIGSQASAEALDYSRKPIRYQLEELRIRQLELDIYADPLGGLFSEPLAYDPKRKNAVGTEANPNVDGVLDLPGFKILHSPDFDYRTTTPTLLHALRQVHTFSKRNPAHIPILVLIELKHEVVGPSLIQTIEFDEKLLDQVDAEIRSVFRDEDMLIPDHVRGNHATLRDAMKESGWPPLSECRGRVWFALDNTGIQRTLYLSGHHKLQDRVMFVSSPKDHPTAAFIKLNDPIRQFDLIVDAVKSGLIVRTRADVETRQARRNDTRRRSKAFASGAQYISTDYPEPDPRLTPYCVQLPGKSEYRINPVSLPSQPSVRSHH